MVGSLVNNELREDKEGRNCGPTEVLSSHLPGGTAEEPASQPRLEPEPVKYKLKAVLLEAA